MLCEKSSHAAAYLVGTEALVHGGASQELGLPERLTSQFLRRQYAKVAAGELKPDARSLALAAVRGALPPYSCACL